MWMNVKEKRERKRVPCRFSYRECDSFAAYLREMSRKGWHFVRWEAGLLFEKGQPEDIVYVVEVFPKGREMDTRPEPDTEEFAEYCEAAGWKLIDSRRKFCIFRREREDAVPIVTQEEQFQNIWKAEWRKWLGEYAGQISVGAMFFWQFYFILPLGRWIFQDIFLGVIFLYIIRILTGLAKGVFLVLWKRRKKRQIQQGEAIVYAQGKWMRRIGDVWNCFSIAFLLFLVLRGGFGNSIIVVVLIVGASSLLALGVSVLRPSRGDNWLWQIGGGIIIGVLAIMIGVIVQLYDAETKNTALAVDLVPLVKADYKEMNENIDGTDIMYSKGILGSVLDCGIDYGAEYFNYIVYESSYEWIIEQIWQQEDDFRVIGDCTEEWGALSAVELSAGYRVRYPNKILVLYCCDKLDQEQIQVVVEKLGLLE